MAKSTYYFEINRNDIVAERNQEVLEEIKNIFEENKRRYGVRRVHQELPLTTTRKTFAVTARGLLP